MKDAERKLEALGTQLSGTEDFEAALYDVLFAMMRRIQNIEERLDLE